MNAGGTREVDEEMDEPRVEKKGEREWERGKRELGVGPLVYAHVRKYESGRVIGLSAAFVLEPPLYFLSNCRF